jgi:hypothetical protein
MNIKLENSFSMQKRQLQKDELLVHIIYLQIYMGMLSHVRIGGYHRSGRVDFDFL